jgi:hypothetical protein
VTGRAAWGVRRSKDSFEARELALLRHTSMRRTPRVFQEVERAD